MSPGIKKFLIPFIIVDTLFFIVLAGWLFHRQLARAINGKADIKVDLRHPESKLTEIDLTNDGNVGGTVNNLSVEVSWPDADLVEAKGLSQFNQMDSSRRSERFFLPPSASTVTVAPGQPIAVGWVKLTDDVPVHAELVPSDNTAATTAQP